MVTKTKQAVIFDIDGTLAHMDGRIARHGKRIAPFQDWDSIDDMVDEKVVEMLHLLSEKYHIIICSGRKDSSRAVTKDWLFLNNIPFDELFMRWAKDNRKDSIIKEEIYHEDIEPFYDVFCVFDDRDQVVDMWRNTLGLKCFQVAEGDF